MEREEFVGRGNALHAWLMAVALGLVFAFGLTSVVAADPLPGGTLDPASIPKYQEKLVIPPAMPRAGLNFVPGKGFVDYYTIAMKQFRQYILPQAWSASQGIGQTTVWSYGSTTDLRPASRGGTLNYPAFTIEAQVNRPVRVKWINGPVDANGNYLPHILPVDQTLH